MVDAVVLDDAKRLVANLRSHGDEYNARVVEHLIEASEAPAIGPRSFEPPDFLTVVQATRRLNVRLQTIKNWVATGQIRTVVVDGQTRIDRRSLITYLDDHRPKHAPSFSHPTDETTRREILSLAYPGDLLQRLRELLDARQERDLSREEREELNRLEKVSCQVSATRLQEWLDQREDSASSPSDHEERFPRPEIPGS
jgi:hypothetical protein